MTLGEIVHYVNESQCINVQFGHFFSRKGPLRCWVFLIFLHVLQKSQTMELEEGDISNGSDSEVEEDLGYMSVSYTHLTLPTRFAV